MINRQIVKDAFSLIGIGVTDRDADEFLRRFPSLAKGGFFTKELVYGTWKLSVFPKLKKMVEEGYLPEELYQRDPETGEMKPFKIDGKK